MNTDVQFIENRRQVDSAIQTLLLETREIVCELVKPLAAQGKFSLDNLSSDRRGNLRSVDDIAQTMDPTALLAVLMECLSARSAQDLHIPGVNFQLVDKVRLIRNDHAHGGADYNDFNDFNYVRDAVKATNDLRIGLLGAGTRPRGRHHEPSYTPSWQVAAIRRDIQEETSGGNLGWTALHAAVTKGYTGAANELISEGVDLNAQNASGWTPLNTAAYHGQTGLVKKLISAGADLELANDGGWTPLHVAVQYAHSEIVDDLISKGGDVNAKCGTGHSPLHLAAESGQLRVVRKLISAGAAPELVSNNGWTPLHVAAEFGQLEVVKKLISAGAALELASDDGRTSLHLAIQYGHPEIANELISQGDDINAQDATGWTPLHLAAGFGQLEVVKKLISAGADLNLISNDGWTPLHNAANYGHATTTTELLDSGALINAKNNKRKTPGQLARGEAIAAFNSRTRIAGKPQYYLGNLGLILFAPALPLMPAMLSVHLVALAFGPSPIKTPVPFLWLLGMVFAAVIIWGVFKVVQRVSDSYIGFRGEIRDEIGGYIFTLIISIPIGFVVAALAYFTISSIFPDSWATGISTGVGGLMAELSRIAPDWKVDNIGFDLPASIEAGGYWIEHLGSRLVATLILLFGLLMLLIGLLTWAAIDTRTMGRKNEELLLATSNGCDRSGIIEDAGGSGENA